MNPPNDLKMPRFLRLWRWSGGVKYLSINVLVEYFLITSLISSAALYREGILDLFLYVALIICAILYHLFVVAANMYLCKCHSLIPYLLMFMRVYLTLHLSVMCTGDLWIY